MGLHDEAWSLHNGCGASKVFDWQFVHHRQYSRINVSSDHTPTCYLVLSGDEAFQQQEWLLLTSRQLAMTFYPLWMLHLLRFMLSNRSKRDWPRLDSSRSKYEKQEAEEDADVCRKENHGHQHVYLEGSTISPEMVRQSLPLLLVRNGDLATR